jgi:hypothetical protein
VALVGGDGRFGHEAPPDEAPLRLRVDPVGQRGRGRRGRRQQPGREELAEARQAANAGRQVAYLELDLFLPAAILVAAVVALGLLRGWLRWIDRRAVDRTARAIADAEAEAPEGPHRT